jgi:hypothetical protein
MVRVGEKSVITSAENNLRVSEQCKGKGNIYGQGTHLRVRERERIKKLYNHRARPSAIHDDCTCQG